MDTREKDIEKLKDYKYGFTTDIENIKAPKGLNEDVIKFISCLLYTSPSPRDRTRSRMPSSA